MQIKYIFVHTKNCFEARFILLIVKLLEKMESESFEISEYYLHAVHIAWFDREYIAIYI